MHSSSSRPARWPTRRSASGTTTPTHSYEAQREGLRIAEPWLAPGALVIVDDTDWDDVARAMDDYVAEQSRVRRVLTIDGKSRGAPQWFEGMQVLVWDG